MMAKKRATHCFVPGCNTKYKKDKLSLFSVPKNEVLLDRWKKLIPRSDNELTANSVICELHFQEDFINRNYVHVINGETVTFPRGKPILKSDAIPTIFPDIPRIHSSPNIPIIHPIANIPKIHPISNNIIKITLPKRRKLRERTSSSEGMVIVDDPLTTTEYSKTSISLNDLRNIKLPTQFWGITIPTNEINSLIFHGSVLQFLNNCPTLIAERMVIVKEEDSKLKCEVFLKGLKVKEYPDISTKHMLESILTKVNLHEICIGAGSIQEFSDTGNLPKQNYVYEGQVFSTKCPRICKFEICIFCKYLRKLMIRKKMQGKHKIKNLYDHTIVYYINKPFR